MSFVYPRNNNNRVLEFKPQNDTETNLCAAGEWQTEELPFVLEDLYQLPRLATTKTEDHPLTWTLISWQDFWSRLLCWIRQPIAVNPSWTYLHWRRRSWPSVSVCNDALKLFCYLLCETHFPRNVHNLIFWQAVTCSAWNRAVIVTRVILCMRWYNCYIGSRPKAVTRTLRFAWDEPVLQW